MKTTALNLRLKEVVYIKGAKIKYFPILYIDDIEEIEKVQIMNFISRNAFRHNGTFDCQTKKKLW